MILLLLILIIFIIINQSSNNKTKLLIGQSSILPLQDYINNIDQSNKTLWGGSVYWFLQSNTFKHNLAGADGECCYPNDCDLSGNKCSKLFLKHKNGMKIPYNFFNSFSEDCKNQYGFSTTNIINNNTNKYGKYLLVALNLKEECFNENVKEGCLDKCLKTVEGCTESQIEIMNNRRLNYLNMIINGKFDNNLQQCNYIIKNNPNIHFLIRIGYEIQLSYFVSDPKLPEDWKNARDIWKSAYKYISDKLKQNVKNVTCVLHIGQEVLFNNNSDHLKIIKYLNLQKGYQFTSHKEDKLYTTVEIMMNSSVDMIGFSVFSSAFSNSQNINCQLQCTNSNKSCSNCNIQKDSNPCINIKKWYNNDYSPIQDSSLRANMYIAKKFYSKPLMICESGLLSPWQCNEEYSIKFLSGIVNIIKIYNISFWSFIGANSWKNTGWKESDGWPQFPFWKFNNVKNFFINNVFKYLDKKN